MTVLPHARHDGSNLASMKRSTLALWAAIMGGGIALRTLVAWAPALRFDIDPVFDPAPFAGLGPAGSLCVDAVIALSAACILAQCASLWALVLLLVAGLASVSIFQTHGVAAAGTPWRGATWIAGFIAAAAAVSLAKSPQTSAKIAWSVLVTCLFSVAAAWWLRGAWQWCVEQPAVVEFFHSNGRDAAFFAQQGWQPDGPQAAAYVRRLAQREMSGWFGFSNIFSALFAAATLAWFSLAWRLQSRDRAVVYVVALLCAAIPLANGSKGAIVAMFLVMIFFIIGRRLRMSGNMLAAGAVLLLIACAFVAPLRALVPADALGEERSLLFRSHYIAGAWRIFLHQPWTGSGIEKFQDVFLMFRPADAVDAVQSAHAVFFDWLAQLGIAAIPLILAVISLLFLAVKGSATVIQTQAHCAIRIPQWMATCCMIVAGTLAIRFEAHSLDAAAFAARLIGVAAAAGFAWWLLPRIFLNSPTPSVLLAAAALTIWIDGQIEMTFWNAGSMIWGCVLLAVSVPRNAPTHRRWFDGGVQWFTAVAAILFSITCFRLANIAAQEETRVELAAHNLVEAALLAKGEPGVLARVECANLLRQSTNGRAAFDLSKAAAVDQFMRAAALCATSEQAQQWLQEATLVSQDMDQNTFQQRQIASLLGESLASRTGMSAHAQAAVDAALRMTDMDPRCAGAWLRAARWSAKISHPVAGQYAKRALESDDSMRFDGLLKLRPADRQEAEQLLVSWPQK